MELKIPLSKGPEFSIEFFNLILDCIDELENQTSIWPDQILFYGDLGKELIDLIKSSNWNMDQFQLIHILSPINKLIIGYSKELDSTALVGIDGKPTQAFSSESVSNKKMNGIPGPSTISKILAHSASSAFKIEKKIKPNLEIKLIRFIKGV